jgi:hypothetical protein
MNNNLRLEEYYPAGSFLRASFAAHRAELVLRFPEFDADYLAKFDEKLGVIKKLEQQVVLTESQKQATIDLYTMASGLNAEMNFLSYYFKKAGFDKGLISVVKKDLRSGNIEGATQKLEGIIQFITDKNDALVAKGMAADFAQTLASTRDGMNAKNELQNVKINALKKLHDDNRKLYTELYGYISTICEAGKIMYKGSVKGGEYTISKLIGRMRSGNIGGGGTPPAPVA